MSNPTQQNNVAPTPAPLPTKPATVADQSKPAPSMTLFHYAECTNCKHLLPLATTTDKYFAILSKDPRKPVGLGEKCMRCGADSWVLSTN